RIGPQRARARTQRSQRKGRGRTQRKGLATKGAKGAKVWVFSILRLLCFLWLNPFLGLMVRTLYSLCPSSGLALWLKFKVIDVSARFHANVAISWWKRKAATGSGACQIAPSTATPSKPRARHSGMRSAETPPSAITSARRGSWRTARSSAVEWRGTWPGLEIDGKTGLKSRRVSARSSEARRVGRSWMARLRSRGRSLLAGDVWGGRDACGWASLIACKQAPTWVRSCR